MDDLYAEEVEENKILLEKLSIMSQVDLYNQYFMQKPGMQTAPSTEAKKRRAVKDKKSKR